MPRARGECWDSGYKATGFGCRVLGLGFEVHRFDGVTVPWFTVCDFQALRVYHFELAFIGPLTH